MATKVLELLGQFLNDYPGMSTAPYSHSGVLLRGNFSFKAAIHCGAEIEDSYKLEIIVSEKFPQALPLVKEIGGKIPRTGEYHVNKDGSLCLGSPLRLLEKIYNFPTLSGFANKCLVPYLYAVSCKKENNADFAFGELAHGNSGIINDYKNLFNLAKHSQVEQAILLLGMRERTANKRLCPCGCQKRLGKCSFRHKLNDFRKMAPLSWFRMCIK